MDQTIAGWAAKRTVRCQGIGGPGRLGSYNVDNFDTPVADHGTGRDKETAVVPARYQGSVPAVRAEKPMTNAHQVSSDTGSDPGRAHLSGRTAETEHAWNAHRQVSVTAVVKFSRCRLYRDRVFSQGRVIGGSFVISREASA